MDPGLPKTFVSSSCRSKSKVAPRTCTTSNFHSTQEWTGDSTHSAVGGQDLLPEDVAVAAVPGEFLDAIMATEAAMFATDSARSHRCRALTDDRSLHGQSLTLKRGISIYAGR